MGVIAVFGVVIVFGGWALWMVIWGLTGRSRTNTRTAGLHPFTKNALLEDGEEISSELWAISRSNKFIAINGMLYFTNRRIIFVPKRGIYLIIAASVERLDYADIAGWQIKKRRQLGIGTIVPSRRSSAILITTRNGEVHTYWAAPGYEIVSKAVRALQLAGVPEQPSAART